MRAHKTNWKMRRAWRAYADSYSWKGTVLRPFAPRRKIVRRTMTRSVVFDTSRGLPVHPLVWKLAK